MSTVCVSTLNYLYIYDRRVKKVSKSVHLIKHLVTLDTGLANFIIYYPEWLVVLVNTIGHNFFYSDNIENTNNSLIIIRIKELLILVIQSFFFLLLRC